MPRKQKLIKNRHGEITKKLIIKQHTIENQCVKEKNQRENEKISDKRENEDTATEFMGHNKITIKRKVHKYSSI